MATFLSRPGYTLRDLLIAVAAVAVLLAVGMMFLEKIRHAGSSARRNACRSYIKQLAVAVANYEDAHKYLPALSFRYAANGPSDFPADPSIRDAQYPWTVSLLPYIEEDELYQQISKASRGFIDDPATILINGSHGTATPSQRVLTFLHCP